MTQYHFSLWENFAVAKMFGYNSTKKRTRIKWETEEIDAQEMDAQEIEGGKSSTVND